MAEKIKENQFDKVGVNPFNAPVPGESLTVSPDSKHSWENPPEYTNDEKALEALYFELTEIDTLRKLINIINDGIPLDEIAQVLLYKGYSEGSLHQANVAINFSVPNAAVNNISLALIGETSKDQKLIINDAINIKVEEMKDLWTNGLRDKIK